MRRRRQGVSRENCHEETLNPYLPTQEYSLGSNHRTAEQNGRGGETPKRELESKKRLTLTYLRKNIRSGVTTEQQNRTVAGGRRLKENLETDEYEETLTPYLPTQEYSLGSNHRTAELT